MIGSIITLVMAVWVVPIGIILLEPVTPAPSRTSASTHPLGAQ